MSNPAETYESYMVPPLFAPCAQRLIEFAQLAPGERVLDLACGTGVVARHAAPRVAPGGAVVGLDLSPNMLNVARTAAEREGLPIEWRQGRAEALEFASASFDVVLCQHALQFIPDKPKALAEARRVLVSGGRIAVAVWQGLDRHPFYEELHQAIVGQLGASSLSEIFALSDPQELRDLLTDAGFGDVTVEEFAVTSHFPNPEGFLAGEIDVDTAAIPAMQHLDARARADMTASIQGRMERSLRKLIVDDQVVIAFHAHLARAVAV
jgi:ubiquinone/menaquinone biosynthesis C-methylase UbiE